MHSDVNSQLSSRRGRLSPTRLEAFSDGVIAVIITIMVLELKVPHASGLAGMREIVPVLLVYLLSFSFVSIYWVNHHLLVSRVEEIDPLTLYTNLLFLFSLSLLPFFTAWLVEKDHSGASVAIYTASLVGAGFSFFLFRLSIQRRLRAAASLGRTDVSEQRKHLFSLFLYAGAFALAFRLPLFALILDAVVTLVWILPHLGAYHVSQPTSPDTHRPA